MRIVVDLFSGLGGATEAFWRDPANYTVLRFENNFKLIPHMTGGSAVFDYTCDITQHVETIVDIIENHIVEVSNSNVILWASPPCDQWSNGYNSEKSEAIRLGREFIPNYDCLDATMQIIEGLQYNGCHVTYAIENVRGGIQFINDRLGHSWRQQAGQMFLWGNFPKLTIPATLKNHKKPDSRHSPIRANIRAKVPYEASKAFKDAIETQSTLFY